ncbi:MAG: hypothetical protein M3Q88_07630 [Pseudomonadota bacterium]|nr:hypothetical protein [Pseudomonadota bacterium]
MTIKQSEISSGNVRTSTSHNAPDPSLRDRAGDAYDSARTAAVDAYDSARERASAASTRAADGIDDAPLIALAGGLAVGVLLAALLPRTEREDKLLGPIGERITGGARTAVEAAKDAGRDKLNELNLTRDAGSSALQTIIKGVSDAALGAVKRPN